MRVNRRSLLGGVGVTIAGIAINNGLGSGTAVTNKAKPEPEPLVPNNFYSSAQVPTLAIYTATAYTTWPTR